jgi:FAD/FMN-containing dehydrogenase
VTADSLVCQVDESSLPDLFWALRGGGGNFGVVTSFDFELHPFGHVVATGDLFFRHEDGRAALEAFRDLLARSPDELYLTAAAAIADDATPVPEGHRGQPYVNLTWVWVGDDPAGGERRAAPLHRVGRPIAEFVNAMTYVELQSGPHGLDRPRRRSYWKSSFLPELPDETLRAFIEATVEVNAGRNLAAAEMLSMGGAIARVAEDSTAYGHRDAMVDFLAVASWTEPAEDDDRMAAARRLWHDVAGQGARGVYVNNLGSEGEDRVREAYGAEKYERLVNLKARFDPDNVFRHTANIRPPD